MQRVMASCGSGSMVNIFFRAAVEGMGRWMQQYSDVLLASGVIGARPCRQQKQEWIMQIDEIHDSLCVSGTRDRFDGGRPTRANCDTGTRVHRGQAGDVATASGGVGENSASTWGEAADSSSGIPPALCAGSHSRFGVRRPWLRRGRSATALETGSVFA